jgi:3-isopropylmalate dehydrogenase
LFLSTAAEEAANHYDAEFREMQIDQLSMRLAREPEAFDVLLLPNLYGDILSDLCAGLVGGLGLIPGANIGWEYAVFEPVHGSAPDIAGRGLANPIAMIGSFGMALRYSFGLLDEADRLDKAIANVLASGTRTKDIAGPGMNAVGTQDVGDAIVKELEALS